MRYNSPEFADFRRRLTAVRSARGDRWDQSRRLVEGAQLPVTLQRLIEALSASNWPPEVKEALLQALKAVYLGDSRDISAELLKQVTGLPAIKAVRALCALLDLAPASPPSPADAAFSPLDTEAFAHAHHNPFELLLLSPRPSLLDLGAGDLTFADQLAVQYGLPISRHGRRLVLHCLDRVNSDSQLGGPLHPEPSRLARLKANPHLEFRYIGDQDMFDLGELDRSHVLLPRYDIVTCWAPATPTFAYEPSRLAASLIQSDLRRTKGEYRTTRLDKEPALEVRHQGRTLLFPPWKFDIRGPLALVQLMATRGNLCLLGAVDTQVFWELLAQLVDDPRARPTDRLFTPEALAEAFGGLYRRLSELKPGDALALEDMTELRRSFPAASDAGRPSLFFRFRHVGIRRGALFRGMPASSTAGLFRHMTEETTPWLVTLVPETFDAPPAQ
jgi:hypothetical protein